MKRLLFILLLFTATGAQAQRTISLAYEHMWSAVSDTLLKPFSVNDTLLINGEKSYYYGWKVWNNGPYSLIVGDTIKILSVWGRVYSRPVDSLLGQVAPGDTIMMYPGDNPVALNPGTGIDRSGYYNVDWCDSLYAVDDSGNVFPGNVLLNSKLCTPITILAWVSIEEFNFNNNCKVYPNPASDRLTVSFKLNERVHAQVYIKDVSGKTVYEKALGQLSGEQKVELQLPELAKGMYLLQLRTGEEVSTQKLLIE